jgi:hypothetical protein
VVVFVLMAVLHRYEAMWKMAITVGIEVCIHGRLLD